MSDDVYTPSTEIVRDVYAWAPTMTTDVPARNEFDRWLEGIKADVWDEAYGTGVADAFTSMDYDGGATPPARVNPHRRTVKKQKHEVRYDIAYGDDYQMLSWDVKLCDCDQPWRHG